MKGNPMKGTTLALALVVAAAIAAGLCSWGMAADEKPASSPAAGKVVKETWDWAAAMQEALKKFKGAPGMVMQVGDSTTRNANAQAWGRQFGHSNESGGYSDSDGKILTWAHADQADSDQNGWYLAAMDVNADRTFTAAKNLTTEGLLQGGPGELPPLKKLLEKYKPQVVVLCVGLIDASRKVKPEDASGNMAKAVDQCLEAGAVPILVTLPPDKTCHDEVKAINAKYLALAEQKRLPVLDLYGEVLSRQPGEKWVNTLTDSEGRKLSVDNATGPATPENLNKYGYLLKSWLVVQKLKEVKEKAIDKK